MARSGMSVTGADRLRKRLLSARSHVENAVPAATQEALDLIVVKAREILAREVYGKSHPAWEENPPEEGRVGSLYQSFATELQSLATAAVQGRVINTAPEAIFLENGTDDEGTGHHTIPALHPVHGLVLAWAGPGGEHFASMEKAHEVKGIVPIHFLRRALRENRTEIVALFRKRLSGLFDT